MPPRDARLSLRRASLKCTRRRDCYGCALRDQHALPLAFADGVGAWRAFAVAGLPRVGFGLAGGAPGFGPGLWFTVCLGVFVVAGFSFGWRCVFAAWLWLPGRPRVSCAGSACPLASVCSGRASLVPGCGSAFASSAAVVRFRSSPAGARWLVALSWLRRAGFVGSLGLVCPAWALPFPSVLSAGWRAGLLPSLFAACVSARAARRCRA